jgi:hypothetical protein
MEESRRGEPVDFRYQLLKITSVMRGSRSTRFFLSLPKKNAGLGPAFFI